MDNSDDLNKKEELDKERLSQWLKMDAEIEESFQSIISKYNYEEHLESIKGSFIFFKSMIEDVLGKYNKSNNLELIELISLLDSCRDNKITISGIVSHPKKGEIKSQVKKVELSSKLDLFYLDLWATTRLEHSQDGLYQYKFNWDFKEKLKHYKQNREVVEYDDFYVEPYTDEELAKILDYERTKKKNEKNYTRNAEYGRCLAFYYNLLQKKDFFTAHKEKEKTGKASGITKEYSFMYDCLVILEATEPLDENKEKYTKVKDWINAFASQQNK